MRRWIFGSHCVNGVFNGENGPASIVIASLVYVF
jgi:hypothetical protein